jgi:formate dehydrogenase major subunit
MVMINIKRHKGVKYVPTLCGASNLDPFGCCRVCSVDVSLEQEGKARTVASCHSPIAEGQYLYPESKDIKDLRRNIIELVLTDHPLDCLTCEVNGNCELQDVAAQVGIRDVRYPEGDNHLDRQKDLSHPYMTSDLSKCINCYRCVSACDEVQGGFVLSMSGRGFDSKIIMGLDQSFMELYCDSCEACS